VSGETLRSAVFENVDRAWTHLHTDSAASYEGLTIEHSRVDHVAGEYTRGDVSTNQAENYFSQLIVLCRIAPIGMIQLDTTPTGRILHSLCRAESGVRPCTESGQTANPTKYY
jgi:hypothetical protein